MNFEMHVIHVIHVIILLNAFFEITVSRVNRNTAENDVFSKGKNWEIGRDRPKLTGTDTNRFVITLLGNFTCFHEFIMFLTYFLKIVFKKEVARFFRNSTVKICMHLAFSTYFFQSRSDFISTLDSSRSTSYL